MSDEQVVGDGKACLAFLRAVPYTTGKVGVFGTCSGGRHAYFEGCHHQVDAVVDCWGGRVVMAPGDLSATYPVAPIDLTKDLSAQAPPPSLEAARARTAGSTSTRSSWATTTHSTRNSNTLSASIS